MNILRCFPPVATPISLKELAVCGTRIFAPRKDSYDAEIELAGSFGVKGVIMTSSGRAALTVILKMLKTMEDNRSDVIIPAYTCPSVAASIVKAGLKVVLCDTEDNGFGYDIGQLRSLISDNTLAVICVHLFGCFLRMDSIVKLAQEKGVEIIEDKAQVATTVNWRSQCSMDHIAFYSLGRGKNITAGGGGIIATNNAEYLGQMRSILNNGCDKDNVNPFSLLFKVAAYKVFINPLLYFIPQHLSFLRLGETIYSTDFKVSLLGNTQSELSVSMIQKVDLLNSERREKGLFYRRNLIGTEGISLIDDKDKNIYLRYPVFIKDAKKREMIYEDSRRNGFGITKMYPKTLDKIKELAPHLSRQGYYPNAERFSNSILTLPTHRWVREKDMSRIINLIKRHLNTEKL